MCYNCLGSPIWDAYFSFTIIMEAINNMREPVCSNKMIIAAHMEDRYWALPNFKRMSSANLKDRYMNLMERRFRLAERITVSRDSSISISEGRHRIPPRVDPYDFSDVIEFEIPFLLAKMRGMTPEEADAFKAQVDAEAEAAMAEAEAVMARAEQAAWEAEAAEAEAEAAEAEAEAARRSLKRRRTRG